LSRLGLECPLGQRREWLGILFPVGERLKHSCARQAQHVGGDRGTITYQDLPVTRQFSQLTERKESLMRAHSVWQQLAVPNWCSRSGLSSGFRWHQVESDLRSLRTVPSYPHEASCSSMAV
jgi:hypothetical protein